MLGAPSRINWVCAKAFLWSMVWLLCIERGCWDLNGTLALCLFVLQLEDDIVAKPNYLSTMKNFALQQPSEEWMILEFSQLGFIGKFSPSHPQVLSGTRACSLLPALHSWPKKLSPQDGKILGLDPLLFLQWPLCLHRGERSSQLVLLMLTLSKNKPGEWPSRQPNSLDRASSF